MKSLKIKITLLVVLILMLTMGLLTGYSMYSSNKHFVTPMQKSYSAQYYSYNNENSIQDENIDTPITYDFTQSQKSFGHDQVIIMICITGFGALLVYIVVAKSLKPLDALNKASNEIDETSLNIQIDLPSRYDEVYYLTKSFNNMLHRLKVSFEIQKNFSQNAAHELKTPLTVIKSSIDVLELDENPTIEDYKENVEVVKESTNELIQIVEQLLSLTSIESIKKDIIYLDQIVLNCLNEYDKDIKERSITVTTNLNNLLINSNLPLLKSLILNLISNAIKYNVLNGKIVITGIEEKNYIMIKISDTGIGIEKENLNHIFEAFYRVDLSRSKQIKGNGLGLSIVKASVEKLGGSISINSEINKGTEVVVKLPT